MSSAGAAPRADSVSSPANADIEISRYRWGISDRARSYDVRERIGRAHEVVGSWKIFSTNANHSMSFGWLMKRRYVRSMVAIASRNVLEWCTSAKYIARSGTRILVINVAELRSFLDYNKRCGTACETSAGYDIQQNCSSDILQG